MTTEPRDGLQACPHCGATGVPADTENTATVTLTIQELRVLVIWAERWASNGDDAEHENMRRVIYGIADELAVQAGQSLTMLGEVADLRRAFPGVEQNVVKEDPERTPQ